MLSPRMLSKQKHREKLVEGSTVYVASSPGHSQHAEKRDYRVCRTRICEFFTLVNWFLHPSSNA